MKSKILTYLLIITPILIPQYLFGQEIQVRERDRDQLQIHQKLSLTDEQEEQIETLKLAHQKEMIDLKANFEKKELEMAELKNKGNYTREEFLNKTNEIISARNKIALSFANHQMDIYQLLDDNQKKEWNKMTHEFGERREKRMQRMMKGIDTE